MKQRTVRYDAVIIGGGIVGTSIARELAARGVRNTLLLDQSTIASGASGRTGAILRRHYSNEAEARLAQEGYLTYRDWSDRIGGDCGFVPHGVVITVDTSSDHVENIERLRSNVSMLQALGIECEILTGDDLRELQPFMETDDLEVVAFEQSSGYVDSIAATQSMASAAEREGVTIKENTAVTGIDSLNGHVSGVRTATGTIAADLVVCAAGPWTPKLMQTAGVEIDITTLRVQIAILQRPRTLMADHVVLVDTAAGVFARPWGPGRSLVGVGGGDQHDEVDPDFYDPRNEKTYAAAAIDAIRRRIPMMADARYLHGHACLYDMSPDAHPIIGPTEVSGLFVAAGFSGAGFKKGPAVGACLAELMLTGNQSIVDLAPFSPDRFATPEWRAPWSDTEYTFSSDFGHGL